MLKCSFIPALMFICFHGPIFPPFIPYVSRTRELVDLFCYIPCPLSVAFTSMFLCSHVPMFPCFCLPCSPFPVFMFLSSYVRCSLFSVFIFLCSNCLCTR